MLKNKIKNARYIIDKNGNKKEVVLSIKEFNELLEDFEDLAMIAERKKDKVVKHSDVIKILRENALL
ncbi:MAG: hypothetical protein AB1775_07435 [Bacteroidota bacterium]